MVRATAWLVCLVALAGPAAGQTPPAPDDAPAAARLILPLLATAGTSAYGKLSTVLEVANVSDTEASYTARLLGDGGGSPLSLLLETTNLGLFPVSVLQETVPALSGQRLVFSPRAGPPGDRLQIVWADFAADPAGALSVSVVLRAEATNGTVSRAAIPPASLYRRAWLHVDNADGSTTTAILINPGDGRDGMRLALRYRDFARTCADVTSITVFPQGGQVALETASFLPCSAGKRGLLEISGPGAFAGIGLVSSGTGGIHVRQLSGQATEPYAALPEWAIAPGQVGFGSPLAGGCVTLAGTQVGGTAYTVHSSKWQRRADAGDAWTDVPGTARTGQLCPYDPTDPGEYRAVAEITVGDERGLFASSDVLTVEEGPAPLPPPIPGLEEFTNSVGMQFVKIPAGEFSMGATGAWAYGGELPVRQVRISEAFWMGKHEVTQGQWQAVMGSNPSTYANCGADCPVESVSWDDVQGFVAQLNEREGGARYRLPTEAEWEYAAKAGTETDTYAGDLIVHGNRDAPLLDGIAWYGGNSGVDYEGGYDCSGLTGGKQYASSRCGTHPVGRKAPNRFALHDMLGNVQEWVQDWSGDYPYGSATDPAGPASGSSRVYRGGSWFQWALNCRLAARAWVEPNRSFTDLGFRLVRVDNVNGPPGGPDPSADEYTPLDDWTVSDGRVQFFFFSAGGCISIGNTTLNGVTYTVHGSKWQRRADASSNWTDIAGTERTGSLCPYSPAEPGQYRGVAEISIDGERQKYSTGNVLTAGGTFQPQTVEVPLGGSGETVTLMTAEDGSIRLGDTQFDSGNSVTASNGNVYVLTLEDGAWTATYVLVEIVVTLGASGETVTIARAEDGTYWTGDTQVNSGDTVTASNGNEYRLELGGDGTWTATLIADAQPTFGTTTVSNQTYTAGTLIAPLTLPAASGGDGTLSYSLSPSVAGLTFSASTRRLTGTPTTPGTYNMTYTVTDADGDAARLSFVVVVNRASAPTGGAGEYAPLDDWTVSDGRVQFFFFSAGRCVNLGNTTLNGVTYTIHSSKWQRRDDANGAWMDIPGTEHTGGVCSYSPTEPGQYRGVAEISIDGERAKYSTKNVLTVAGGQADTQLGHGLAPVDQSAFDELVLNKRVVTFIPDHHIDFTAAGRFRETLGSDVRSGTYTYERHPGDTDIGILDFDYGNNYRCVFFLRFVSRTEGDADFQCREVRAGSPPPTTGRTGWMLTDIP